MQRTCLNVKKNINIFLCPQYSMGDFTVAKEEPYMEQEFIVLSCYMAHTQPRFRKSDIEAIKTKKSNWLRCERQAYSLGQLGNQ